jgi:hypothetical protein
VQNVQGVQDMLADIARAGTEQATALTEVNMAVSSMAGMTQATAAMVEESAAASTQMMSQIRALETELSQVRGHGQRLPSRVRVQSGQAMGPVTSGREVGPEALVAYDRRRANSGHRVVLNEVPAGPFN